MAERDENKPKKERKIREMNIDVKKKKSTMKEIIENVRYLVTCAFHERKDNYIYKKNHKQIKKEGKKKNMDEKRCRIREEILEKIYNI